MKTPDAVSMAAESAYPTRVYDEDTDEFVELDPDSDKACELEDARDDFAELAEKWFSYGECVTLEIDTEAETCRVVPVND